MACGVARLVWDRVPLGLVHAVSDGATVAPSSELLDKAPKSVSVGSPVGMIPFIRHIADGTSYALDTSV